MAVVTGQRSTRGLAEFQCGQPCGWGGRFGERGSTATRHQRLKPVPYATCRSADDTASKAASRIHDTDPGAPEAHVQEYVMPDNKFLVGVACGAATVLGLGTHPGLRHHLDSLAQPVRPAYRRSPEPFSPVAASTLFTFSMVIRMSTAKFERRKEPTGKSLAHTPLLTRALQGHRSEKQTTQGYASPSIYNRSCILIYAAVCMRRPS